MKRVISLLAVVMILLAASVVQAIAAPVVPSKKAAKAMQVTDADNGKTVPVAVGKLFNIVLKGNATTGFQWQLDKIDGAGVQQIGKMDYVTDKNPQKMVGVGGTYIYHFKVMKPGETKIHMSYARSWEKDTPPAQKFEVVIDSTAKKSPKAVATPGQPKSTP
jgi:inhibitor of cysteine peptidase